MNQQRIHSINVPPKEALPAPAQFKMRQAPRPRAHRTVIEGRRAAERILDRKDHRFLVVVGPCSIHDPQATLEYARRLKALADDVQDTLCIVMRAYFEKPRSTTGWKGLINDPHMDRSFDIVDGLRLARTTLLEINQLGLPAATEALDPIVSQYLSDLVAWTAIGARTAESQTHREMASGLSTPVGFKNGTDGGLQGAINALMCAAQPHSFLGIDQSGGVTVMRTPGNAYGHIVLRGGSAGPNFDSRAVACAEAQLARHGLAPNIMIDCSHANSNKDPARQILVVRDIARQIAEGNRSIVGVMLESNLNAGNQSIPPDLRQLQFGVSVTDACIDWHTTDQLLREMRSKLRDALPRRLLRTAQIAALYA